MLVNAAEFYDCRFHSVVPVHGDGAVFVLNAVVQILQQAGFTVEFSTPQPDEEVHETDEELIIVERMLRTFMRSSGVNENTLQKRLGAQAGPFFRDILPGLGSVVIVIEVPFTGRGSQRRFRLGVSLERLRELVEQCGGRYEEFLRLAGISRD